MTGEKQSEKHHFIQQLNHKFEILSYYPVISLIVIGLIGFLIRLYYFPYDVPLTLDAVGYFWYAIDMTVLGRFPEGYNFPNNGWPSFISLFFSLVKSENFLDYMNLQRYLSISISVLTIIPVYLLCTRFVNKSYSLIGVALFVLDPRIIQNSLAGITEPSYILLGCVTILLFLSKRMVSVYSSFGTAALFSLVRYEGLFIIIPISIMFFVRLRKEKMLLPKYFLAFTIFLLVLVPMAYIRIVTIGNDGLMYHAIESPSTYYSSSIMGNSGRPSFTDLITKSLYNFIQYAGWVMIPSYGFFVPLGALLFLKQLDYKKTTIILFAIIFILPALYAYSRGFQDTRYLYVLYPIFSVLSLYTVEKINFKTKNPGIVWIALIVLILSASLLFLDYKNINYEHERQAFRIAQHIAEIAKGINDYYPEAKFLSVSELKNHNFPILSTNISKGPKLFSTEGFTSLNDFIGANKKNGLTHIIVDDAENRPDFVKRLFLNDDEYSFLVKEFDSSEYGYTYHVKVYKINYDKLN